MELYSKHNTNIKFPLDNSLSFLNRNRLYKFT